MRSQSKRRGAAAEADTRELQEVIRAAGLRSTAPRLAVLRFLQQRATPVSHPELVAALGEQGFDRATLYRNLVDLAQTGLVSRRDLGDHVWRYELKRAGGSHQGEHPHFTCTDCGTVECLTDAQVTIAAPKGPKSVTRRRVEVQLRGVCDDCTPTA
ncbi:MAG: transcriptional repressor [Myxococcaceae bacterium]